METHAVTPQGTIERPVILHIPHASTLIPDADMAPYTVTRAHLERENLRLADMHTDTLYDLPGAARAVFPVSRFLVDPERFSDDAQEPMAARGMGALYTVDTDLKEIRTLDDAQRRDLMERYYWPHHHALDETARLMLERFGVCTVFDCHSYPSKALPYELERMGLHRPQIGIGTDAFHTPPALANALAEGFKKRGYEVGLDTPFSGALVPNAFYGRDKRVCSVMMEVRKDLYMDEATGAKLPRFDKVKADIAAAMADALAAARIFLT